MHIVSTVVEVSDIKELHFIFRIVRLVSPFKGPTLSPAYPRIGYITLRCQSQLTGLNCLWSTKHEMRVH